MGFKKEQYYRTEAVFHPDGTKANVKVNAVLDTKFKGIDEARKFLEDSKGANFVISSIDKKEGTKTPPAPFTTSTLQQEASRKLKFPVNVTMRVAQSLYERGLITYMRTDSTNLSGLAINTAKAFILDNFGEEYSKTRQYKTHSKGAQEAHEAIRPTYIENTSIEGTAQEQKLYNLIWKRTIASQMADAKVERTDIKISSDKRSEKFALQASQVIFDGFLKVYMEGSDDQTDDEEIVLPEMLRRQDVPSRVQVRLQIHCTSFKILRSHSRQENGGNRHWPPFHIFPYHHDSYYGTRLYHQGRQGGREDSGHLPDHEGRRHLRS